ncbi:MAG: hypothetical protein RR144_01750 [Clostridia bacterium]
MKIHKKTIILIILSLIAVCLLYNFTCAKFITNISGKSNGKIATPIIELIGSDKIVGKDYDDTARKIEYNFSVNNFDSEGNINQINLNYILKIKNDNLDFPITYNLYDGNNKEIFLNNNATNLIGLDKDIKITHHYKLIIRYADKGNGINIVNKLNNLDITLSASQIM